MFLPKLSLVAPMGLGFVAIQFPAHCSWSNLEKNGANISGLILATQRIIDKHLANNHNTPAQPQLTQEEVDTVVDYIAAMELEKSLFNLPDSHAKDARILLEHLKSSKDYIEAIAKIAERKKYYTFLQKPLCQRRFRH